MKRTHHHFSRVAHKYRSLRTTDPEPILFIKKKLQNLAKIEAADVGCGAGRYDLKLFQYLGNKLHLYCIDVNEKMLKHLARYLRNHKIKKFKTIQTTAKHLLLPENSLNCIFTFNAVHHFNFLKFLKEASRVLKMHGYLFIYTRLRSQNKRNIWGRYFPKFHQKEKRLYELSKIKKALKRIPVLKLESIEYFKYKRESQLKWLIAQAGACHYSTFCFYEKKEFKNALQKFQENIIHRFKNPNKIIWNDESIMLVIRKKEKE